MTLTTVSTFQNVHESTQTSLQPRTIIDEITLHRICCFVDQKNHIRTRRYKARAVIYYTYTSIVIANRSVHLSLLPIHVNVDTLSQLRS